MQMQIKDMLTSAKFVNKTKACRCYGLDRRVTLTLTVVAS